MKNQKQNLNIFQNILDVVLLKMKKLLLLFVLVAAMSACTHKTQPATVVAEDSVVVVENVVDTTAVDSIVSNDSIQ